MKNLYSKPMLLSICLLLLNHFGIAQFSQQAKIVSPERESRAEFGTATDIWGDYAISGSPRYNIAAGSAYIYAKDATGHWGHHQTLAAFDSKSMAEFGGGVKIGDDFVVVASGRADIGTVIRAGALYIYDKNGTSWDFSTKIVASDFSDDAKLGMNHTSLDVEGETIIAGAPGENVWAGSVYIFERIGGVWTEIQKIVNPNSPSMDSFGIGVAISGNILVIGANEANGLRGRAFIYVKDSAGQWILEQQINASDGAPEDYFGTSVSIDGETIAVGAFGHDDVKGATYVFKKNSSGLWEEVQILTASVRMNDAHFGFQCEIKDNRLVIGAPHAWAATEGEVFLFQENTVGVWEQTQRIQSNDIKSEDFFGWSVAMHDDQIIAGAPWESTDANGNDPMGQSGSAYIFRDPNLGIEAVESAWMDLKYYPNPTHDFLLMESKQKAIHAIALYGVNGVLVKNILVGKRDNYSLNLSTLSTGLYFMTVEFEDGRKITRKIGKI